MDVGIVDGVFVGTTVGQTVGTLVGIIVGITDGLYEGTKVGAGVGLIEGDFVGVNVGVNDGTTEGLKLGAGVGPLVGFGVGAFEGANEIFRIRLLLVSQSQIPVLSLSVPAGTYNADGTALILSSSNKLPLPPTIVYIVALVSLVALRITLLMESDIIMLLPLSIEMDKGQ